MACIKTDCVHVPTEFQIELLPGWLLDIDLNCSPIKYTLNHGKKSMSFHSHIMKDLIERNYSLRLVKGRRQMVLPASILEEIVTYADCLCLYDGSLAPLIE